MKRKTFHFFPSRLPVARLRALCFLFSVLCSLLAFPQGGSFRAASESQIPLSIAQEAEGAIDKGQRWLAAQPPPAGDLPRLLLRRYALAPADAPFTLSRCDLTPLQQAMPGPTPPTLLTNLTAALDLRPDPKALFARLALALIGSQRIDPHGGHWGDADATAWALLTLRALLNASPPLRLTP